MKVFLGDEGPDDLGDWFHLPSYRTSPPRKGVVEALLARAGSPEIPNDARSLQAWLDRIPTLRE